MKRISVLLLVMVVLVVVGPRTSRADVTATPIATTSVGGICFSGPFNVAAPCNPTPSGIPTRAPIVPVKELGVSGPVVESAGVSRYGVTLTSQLVCFTQSEPIYVYTFGQTGAAALSIPFPTGTAVSTDLSGEAGDTAQQIVLTPGPSGTSALSLEVFNAALGGGGIGVAAAWPEEGIYRSQVLVPPSAGTPVTGTATAVATPAATTTPVATATPAPGPFPLRACVSPNPGTQTGTSTLYVQTAPGAICTATASYGAGSFQFLGGSVVAGSDGFAVFPFSPSGSAGTASVACTLLGVRETTSTTFTAAIPPATGGNGGVPLNLNCSASGTGIHTDVKVNFAHPAQNTVQLVVGCIANNNAPIPGVPVTFQFSYANATTLSCATFTGTTGLADCDIDIGKAPLGYAVQVTAFFSYNGGVYTSTTSFTPVAAMG